MSNFTLSMYELLDSISKTKKEEDKILKLQENNSNALQTIRTLAFDDITWLLPEGEPPYNPNTSNESHGMLQNTSVLRKIRIFIQGTEYDELKPLKRESLFVAFLESLDKKDAELIIALKDKKWPWKNLPKELFDKAFS